MKKKCKVCGAPLNHERCEYCGTNHETSEQSNPETTHHLPNNDVPSNDLSEFGFDSPDDLAQTFNSDPQTQHHGQMQYFDPRPPKKSNTGLIIGIVSAVVIAIVAGALFFNSISFTPYGTHADSPLLGTWENGRGSMFLWVFGEADSVEFLENGTLRMIENGRVQTATWVPGANGTFRANRSRFRYSINDNNLVITDSANDDWRFDRVVEAEVVPENDDISNENEIYFSEADLIGVWEWDSNNNYFYRFNADGTGYRDFEGIEAFEWFMMNGELHLEFEVDVFFGVDYEMWRITFDNNIITLDSLQGNIIYNYIFAGE